MKKSKKYMSDEDFSLLVESFNQAIEYERGERDDLRVTVLAAPPSAKAKATLPKKSLKQIIADELENLSTAELTQMADYMAFLKFRDRVKTESAKRRAAA